MTFVTLGVYCAVRYRLFARAPRESFVVTFLVLFVLGLAIAAERWSGHAYAPWRFVILAYMVASAVLGFFAPRSLLGSSDKTLTQAAARAALRALGVPEYPSARMSDAHSVIEKTYRDERPRVVASLIRVLSDFDLAEEVVEDAFVAAIEQWGATGIPDAPAAWLYRTARHKAIDRIRRRVRFADKEAELAAMAAVETDSHPDEPDPPVLEDDRLRLFFICCHPALPLEGQIALTLRTVAGLSTEEVAAAFLVPVPTMAQRLVRAKAKIKDAGIPYRIPPEELLTDRVEAVLSVVYLTFTEGYAATSGDVVIRRELCSEAIRLARLLLVLLPDRADVTGLLALMLLQDSRKSARVDAQGDIVLLEDQDRSQWDHEAIAEGLRLVPLALKGRPTSSYALQAAIAAVHARAATSRATDWAQIAGLYAVLARVTPSPVVELNRAVAVAMAEGPAQGLALLNRLEQDASLAENHLLAAARADLLARLGRTEEARAAYAQALARVGNAAESRLLARKLAMLEEK